jgi:hypothetical protein
VEIDQPQIEPICSSSGHRTDAATVQAQGPAVTSIESVSLVRAWSGDAISPGLQNRMFITVTSFDPQSGEIVGTMYLQSNTIQNSVPYVNRDLPFKTVLKDGRIGDLIFHGGLRLFDIALEANQSKAVLIRGRIQGANRSGEFTLQ